MFWSKAKIACVGLFVLVFAGSGTSIVMNRARGARHSDPPEVVSERQAPTGERRPEGAPVKKEGAAEAAGLDNALAVLRNRRESQNNLQQIANALLNYASAYGSLPPQATRGKDGRPLLSWRVLILPYLEQQNLYREFNQNEPWDSPHNKKLLAIIPKVYAPPGRQTSTPLSTYYQVFVGKGAGFEGGKGLRYPDEFPDGAHNTLAVVEAGSPVPWTKPEDLPYAADHPLPPLSGLFDGVFNGVVFDGSVMVFKKDADPKLLRAAITRNGGEVLDIDQLLATPTTGVRINAEDIRKANRRLRQQWELARAELEKVPTVKPSRVPLDNPDPETAFLMSENGLLHRLLQTTQARIEEVRTANKKQQPPP